MLSLLVALTAPALAAAPQWAWPVGTPQLYHLESQMLTPRGVRYYMRENLDARASAIAVVADTTCGAALFGKQAWEVTCTFNYVKITGHVFDATEQGTLDQVLAEWSERIGKSTVVFTQGRDGKMRVFDVQGEHSVNARDASIVESHRALLQRVFSLFELRIPAVDDADAWKRGWEEKGVPAVLQLQTTSGTVGAAHLKFTSKGEHSGLYKIDMEGRATVTAGSTLEVSSGTYSLDVHAASTAQFDLAAGVLGYRDLLLQGYRTVSSNDTGSDAEFMQTSAMQRVAAFGKDGAAPAAFADKIEDAPPEAPDGVQIVAFSELGMAALFIPSIPDEAKALGIGASSVQARVVVDATGKVTAATAYAGYSALIDHAELALRSCHFPVREAKPYVVDVVVEFRGE